MVPDDHVLRSVYHPDAMDGHARPGAPLMLSVSGCRGIVGESMTDAVAARYALAALSWLREDMRVASPTVVIGRDGRKGGDALHAAVIDAMALAGCRVIDLGVAMTPTVAVMVGHRRADAGLVITASHNPAEWNGVKVIGPDGAAPPADAARRIIARYKQGDQRVGTTPAAAAATEQDDSSARVHVERVLAALAGVCGVDAIRRRAFKVVLDSVNASGAVAGRLLLKSLGCDLVHINAEASGVFPHGPEPTRENLGGLCDEVRRRGADVGFAQDPDADRLAIIDEQGRYIGEEYTLVLSALGLLGVDAASSRPINLVANLSTSRMIDDAAERLGGRVWRAPVGEANVAGVMKRVNAVLGGEGNGGVIWPAVSYTRDSLAAMALTLALLAREAMPVSRVIRTVPAYAIEKRKIDLTPGLVDRVLVAVEALFPGARIDRQDGVRLDFAAPSGSGAAWIHVRASNTEPILRLIAEAPTGEDCRLILDRAEAAVVRA